METNFKSQIDLRNLDPEVRSYIYQMLVDFEPFTTPSTMVAVAAKDPLALIYESDEDFGPIEDVRKLWRISISLSEDGASIEEEGVDVDIYSALRKAKDKLLLQLTEIQDNVLSQADRTAQIQNALDKTELH